MASQPEIASREADPEAFLSAVEDAANVIAGLRSGKLSAESPAVEAASQRVASLASGGSATAAEEKKEEKEEEEKEAGKTAEQNEDNDSKASNSEEVQRKVEELKAAFLQREQARERFQRYTAAKAERDVRRGMGENPTAAAAAAARKMPTDYRKWELFTPSLSDDEDEDVLKGYRPNTPEVRAMEADIEERHKRQRERRQTAERQRVAGNDAFARKQYGEALRCYGLGLEADKRNMTLHCNAALAALKLSCPVQAVGMG